MLCLHIQTGVDVSIDEEIIEYKYIGKRARPGAILETSRACVACAFNYGFWGVRGSNRRRSLIGIASPVLSDRAIAARVVFPVRFRRR